MKDQLNQAKEKMQKSIDVLASEFSTVRAGRVSGTILDKISVPYYGTPTPINQVGTVSSPDPKTLVIQPWDTTILKDIEKAIQTSDIGVNPQNDGKVIRLSFPPLTEERRKELVKQISKYGEECKVAVRNIRRDFIDKFKDMKKKSEITEDDLKHAEKDMQDITDKFTKEVEAMVSKKSKELSEI